MTPADTQPLRLLYVIDSLGHGGAEQSLVAMLPEYRARGVATVIVTLVARDTNLIKRAEAAGARVVQAPATHVPAQAIWLRRAIGRLHPSLVHTTLFRADLVARMAGLGTGVPVLTSVVNTQYEPQRLRESAIPGWKLRMAQEIERWGGRIGTDHFHVNSEAVRTFAVDHLSVPPSAITVVPRGRDPERYQPPSEGRRSTVRARLGVRPGEPLLLTVGRQEPQKGQHYLIDAFGQVLATEPHAKLALVGGPGAASDALRARIEGLGLSERIMLLGRRDDVPDLLAAADLFVLSSLWEGLPNVVIEAMATGLPVVATDIAPVREAVDAGRSAVLAAPADPEDLARAMIEVLADPARRVAMGRRGREVFLERFTIGPVADSMVALYAELVDTAERA